MADLIGWGDLNCGAGVIGWSYQNGGADSSGLTDSPIIDDLTGWVDSTDDIVWDIPIIQ